MDIPEFGGDLKKYRGFWNTFQVAIDSKATLSKVSKFTHLKKALVGDAVRSVHGLECTDANYDEAVDILKKRFGNKQIIISSHMDDLTNLTQVSDNQDTKKLRSLYDKIEGNLRSLKGLGIQPDQYGSLLVPILIGKIPDQLTLHISRKFDSTVDVWKVDDVMMEFKRELEARERCLTSHNTKPKKAEKKVDPTMLEALLT